MYAKVHTTGKRNLYILSVAPCVDKKGFLQHSTSTGNIFAWKEMAKKKKKRKKEGKKKTKKKQ